MSIRKSWDPDLAAKSQRVDASAKFKNSRSSLTTLHLVLLPVILSLIPIAVLAWIRFAGFRETPAQIIVSGITFFLWGCTGLPMIVRKEIPWFPKSPGWVAVVQGTFFVIIGWGIAFGFAIALLNSLL